LDATADAYAKRLLGLESMKAWYEAGIKETIRDLPHEKEIMQMGTVLQDLRAS
jgi:glutathione S-transferase